jgi:hypothetical protein
MMPQSLSQLDAHLIFSSRDRFPFPKDCIRERVHSDRATTLRDMGTPFKPWFSLGVSYFWPVGNRQMRSESRRSSVALFVVTQTLRAGSPAQPLPVV